MEKYFSLMLVFLVALISISVQDLVFGDPAIIDGNFKIEKIVSGLNFPVQMEFVGDDLLILQKNDGQVRFVKDGVLQKDPVLTVDVYNKGHLGLLGIENVDKSIYLYFSQNSTSNSSIVNRIYQYDWDGKELKNPVLVNELPTGSAFDHSGGVLTADKNKNVYAIIGDTLTSNGILQNNPDESSIDGPIFDDTSIILKVGNDPNILRPSLSKNPTDHYFGIGIRNSFGLTVDPITGNLWDTENGDASYDEVNLVNPKFNSGWNKIMGPASQTQIESLPKFEDYKYSDPEFSWEKSIAPTAIIVAGNSLGEAYRNTVFVGDFNTGTIYKFQLNSDRTGFEFKSPKLKDLVANTGDPLNEIAFGVGFGAVFDIDFGPDDAMYVLSFIDQGSVFKISHKEFEEKNKTPFKQGKEGLSSNQISCKTGFVIMEKLVNRGVYCVEPNTAIQLMGRDWGVAAESTLGNCLMAPKLGVDWSNCDFSFRNLSDLNLTGANLTNTSFVGANLANSKLRNTDLTSSTLVFADLSGSDLSNSKLIRTKLLYSNLQNSTIINSLLNSANLSYADLTGANLTRSTLNNSYFTNSNLSNSDMSDSSLVGAILHFANLTNANLSYSNLDQANFYLADLADVNFDSCQKHAFCEKPQN